MPLDEPSWWYGSGARAAVAGSVLAPAGFVYGKIAKSRFNRIAAYRSALPVICVGNLTAGGTGKTPLSIHIAELAQQLGERPVFLTRGYGGQLDGPVGVDPTKHSPSDVGDEPLLLVRSCPVMISADRAAGARAIEAGAYTASVIIMDDGLQNPGLAKDLTLAVIDGQRGIGNGRVIPAGPLRAPLDFQLGKVDVLVLNGGGSLSARKSEIERGAGQAVTRPWLQSAVVAMGDTSWLKGARVFAYAGIGNPSRFFETLTSLGAVVTGTAQFRDHQVPTAADATELLRAARAKSAILITTEKDYVRLPLAGHPRLMDLKAQSRTLPVKVVFDGDGGDVLKGLISTAMAKHRKR